MTQLPPTEAHRVVVQRQAERRRRSEIQQLVNEPVHEASGARASDLVGRLLGRPAHAHPVRVPVLAEPGFILEPEA